MTDENIESEKEAVADKTVAAIRADLPDYPGFAQIENRHASDEMLRAHLRKILADFQHQMLSVVMFLSSRGEDALKTDAARLEQRIETVADKIQSAPYSFSPFFSFDRVPEESQEKVIEDDRAVLAVAGEIARLLEPTLGDDADFKRLHAAVEKLITTLDEKIETRVNDIMEFH